MDVWLTDNCSWMQPHQKGQVVDLLSVRGIDQLFEGHPRFIQAGLNRIVCLLTVPCCKKVE